MTPLEKSSRPAWGQAFSLVEVVVAIGIVAIGLISVLGLMSTSLEQGRYAAEEFRASQIADAAFEYLRSQDPASASSPWVVAAPVIASATAPVWTPVFYRVYDDQIEEVPPGEVGTDGTYLVEVLGLFDPGSTSYAVLSARVISPWLAAAPSLPAGASPTPPPPPSAGVAGSAAKVRKFTTILPAP